MFPCLSDGVSQERGSSAVERQTRNDYCESPGLNPLFDAVSKIGHFRSLHDAPVDSAVNVYLAMDSGGSVSE